MKALFSVCVVGETDGAAEGQVVTVYVCLLAQYSSSQEDDMYFIMSLFTSIFSSIDSNMMSDKKPFI